jgi:predicted DNA binding CopG/RHH family protein
MNQHEKLDIEEQELLDSYEGEEWQSVIKLQERLRQYQTYAAADLEAIGLVSIALAQEDVKAIREEAAAAGMSYQTLIADIVHRYVSGKLVEQVS